MEILDMELRADKLKWHQESEVSVGRARGFAMRFMGMWCTSDSLGVEVAVVVKA